MLQTHAQIWGTLKRYLAYTAAGFVVLGGVGAMEAAQPPVVGQASASQILRESVSAEALLASSKTAMPSWAQRLHFDLVPTAVAITTATPQHRIAAATPTPYYPARDTAGALTAEPAQGAASTEKAADATPQPAPAAEEMLPTPPVVTVASAAAVAAPAQDSRADDAEVGLETAAGPAPTVQSAAPQPAAAPVQNERPASSSLVATLNWVFTGKDTMPTDAEIGATDADPAATDAASNTDSATTDAAPDGGDQRLASVDPAVDPAMNPGATADELAAEKRVVEVRRGDTLFGLLTQAGVTEAEAQAAGHSLADVFSPSDLRVGQEITLSFATGAGPDTANNNKLVGLTLAPSLDRDVKLTRGTDGQFVAASVDKPLTERIDRAAGQIDVSLFETARDAGVPVGLIGDIIKAFSYDVDFQRDIHDGDAFEAMYERYDNEKGDLAKAGRLLYASLTVAGKPMAIYYFEKDGDGEYYTSDGVAVRKSLLKTPIDGAKITSGFGMRVNPILGYSMMHQGIDFGAPVGTPIFAAGNGTVEEMDVKNGYGNYMKLRHNSTYETAYAHISRFASGLKRGSKVKQGQVIAYVGETGRATGPHLHFEILINGEHVNPSTVKTVAADKLVGQDLKTFKAQVASIDSQRRDLINHAEIADQSGGNVPLDCGRLHGGCQN